MSSEDGVGVELVDRTLPDLDRTSASVFARDLRTGDRLVAYDESIPQLPASNAKLVTAARGFAELGAEFRFTTGLYAAGTRDGERLHGDLIIVGRGAPDLSRTDLMSLADAVSDSGISTIVGGIVVDASAFDGQTLGPGWTWDDQQFEYGAKSTPFALNRNTVDITVSHNNGTIEADATPASNIVRTEVDVDADEEREGTLSVYKKRASEVIRVEGNVPPGDTLVASSPIDDPMLHAGQVFGASLEAKGIDVDGFTRIDADAALPDCDPLGAVESAPLSELVGTMLTRSDNFYAEQLARRIALERTGCGTWDAWQDHVTSFLETVDGTAARLRDGSGLSRYNLVSASTIASIIEWSIEQPWGDRFYAGIPETGVEGTVADRLEDVPVTVRAKTGTLTGARALSGVIESDAGRPAIVFSCLLSNLTDEYEPDATDHIDAFVRELIAESDLDG